MATSTNSFTPIVGKNMISSFFETATPANLVLPTAGVGNGRPGRTKCLLSVLNPAAATPLDLTLFVKSPTAFPRDAMGVAVLPPADLSKLIPACDISFKSGADAALVGILPRISVAPSAQQIVDGQIKVLIEFAPGVGAVAVEYNVSIDFAHTATN